MLLTNTAFTKQLTPKIREEYTDLTLLSTEDERRLGYLVFQAKSRTNDQIHHIRALNCASEFVQQDTNTAITLFIQETLRLYSLNPKSILLDTVEFFDNQLCYAMKPISSQVQPSQNLNLASLLKNLLTDLTYLSSKGADKISLPTTRIHQVTKKSQPLYFIQDWCSIAAENAAANDKLLQTLPTKSIKEAIEKENIYNLALSVLELCGLNKQEIKSLYINAPSFYEEALKKVVLENPNLDNKIFTPEIKDVLLIMLTQPKERPTAKYLLKVLEILDKDEVTFKTGEEKKTRAVSTGNSDGKQKIEKPEQSNGTLALSKAEDKKDKELSSAMALVYERLHPQIRELLMNLNPRKINEVNLEKDGADMFAKIGAAGAVVLSSVEIWTNLAILNLAGNWIGDEGAAAVAGNASWSNLVTINLSDNSIGPKGAEALSNNTIWTKLKLLNLGKNSLSVDGAAALSKNKSWKNLHSLILTQSGLGALGVAWLGKNVSWVNLSRLELASNWMGSLGVFEFCNNKAWAKLTHFTASRNSIGTKGEKSLKNRWPNIVVEYV